MCHAAISGIMTGIAKKNSEVHLGRCGLRYPKYRRCSHDVERWSGTCWRHVQHGIWWSRLGIWEWICDRSIAHILLCIHFQQLQAPVYRSFPFFYLEPSSASPQACWTHNDGLSKVSTWLEDSIFFNDLNAFTSSSPLNPFYALSLSLPIGAITDDMLGKYVL